MEEAVAIAIVELFLLVVEGSACLDVDVGEDTGNSWVAVAERLEFLVDLVLVLYLHILIG